MPNLEYEYIEQQKSEIHDQIKIRGKHQIRSDQVRSREKEEQISLLPVHDQGKSWLVPSSSSCYAGATTGIGGGAAKSFLLDGCASDRPPLRLPLTLSADLALSPRWPPCKVTPRIPYGTQRLGSFLWAWPAWPVRSMVREVDQRCCATYTYERLIPI
jgi:hypothetical protein